MMHTFGIILTHVLLAFAWIVAIMNLHCVWENSRVEHNVSTVPLLAQILVALAWMTHESIGDMALSPWLFIGSALADVSLWQMLHGLWRLAAGRNS